MRFRKHAVEHKGIGICTINNHTVNSFLMQEGLPKISHSRWLHKVVAIDLYYSAKNNMSDFHKSLSYLVFVKNISIL